MSNPLDSARIKLKRANLHVATAKREMFRFFKAHPEPIISGEPYGDSGRPEIGMEFSFQMVVERGYPDLPDSFAARFGDAIHNYRCVLDHVAWQLVLHGSIPKLTQPWDVQFPIYRSARSLRSRQNRRLPGVASEIADFIYGFHNYKRGKATNEALMALADLSNADKHQTVHLIIPAFSGIDHIWTFTDCRPIRSSRPAVVPEAKTGAVVARLTCLTTGPNPNVEMKLTPFLYVTLDDRRPMFPLLYGIHDQVIRILNAPEIAAGLK